MALDTVTRLDVKLGRGKHHVWLLGCTHFGAPKMDLATFKRHLAEAKESNWRALHLGDVAEAVTTNWRAADLNNIMGQTETPAKQLATAASYLDQIPRFDGAIQGNHDDRFGKTVGGNPWQDGVFPRLRRNKPTFLGYTGYVTYHIGGTPVVLVLNHLTGGGANLETGINRLKSANEGGDVYVGGHLHTPMMVARRVRTTTGNRTVYSIRVGSYLYAADYADQANYGSGGCVGSYVVTLSQHGVEGIRLLV